MPTYAEQLAELEKIVARLQNPACDIASKVTLTRRATELLDALRQRLTTTDEELKTILSKLQSANA